MQGWPQSKGQVPGFSLQSAWHSASPQKHSFGQSSGHQKPSSKHCGWQRSLPHSQISDPQSPTQVSEVSPQAAWQVPLPQMHG